MKDICPLSIERHEEYDGWHKTDVIYLAHTYVQNGDLMSDPFIKIMVNEELGAASAIYYQQDGLGIYQMIRGEFEDENGNPFLGVNQQAEKDCNNFLLIWLGNIKDQGFDIKGALKHQTLLA